MTVSMQVRVYTLLLPFSRLLHLSLNYECENEKSEKQFVVSFMENCNKSKGVINLHAKLEQESF